MKTNYTDEQITDAFNAAFDHTSPMAKRSILLRAFFNALPEPADDYPEMPFHDVRVGDRVLITTTADSFYEVTILKIYDGFISWDGARISEIHVAKVQLIDRSIQPPNPAEHPVIIVHETGYSGSFQPPISMVSHDGAYIGGGYDMLPESITIWSPAKVVTANE